MSSLDSAKIQRYILTFGYGNRKDYQLFLYYIQMFDVKCVVDVRISPRAWSRKWYKEQLQSLCVSKNVKYLSKTALGNTSGKENWIPPNQEEADAAIQEIAKLSRQENILLLCAEINPLQCHRKDVADRLGKIVSLPIKHLE
jgi:hypothetical protein